MFTYSAMENMAKTANTPYSSHFSFFFYLLQKEGFNVNFVRDETWNNVDYFARQITSMLQNALVRVKLSNETKLEHLTSAFE